MKLRYCDNCRTYTLADACRKCGESTRTPHPPKFSPKDPYGEYRRKLKLEWMGKSRGQVRIEED